MPWNFLLVNNLTVNIFVLRARKLAPTSREDWAIQPSRSTTQLAPAHRHTQNALRFNMDGDGAFTAVDG